MSGHRIDADAVLADREIQYDLSVAGQVHESVRDNQVLVVSGAGTLNVLPPARPGMRLRVVSGDDADSVVQFAANFDGTNDAMTFTNAREHAEFWSVTIGGTLIWLLINETRNATGDTTIAKS